MVLALTTMSLPLKADANGVVRVGGTRVTLDTIIHAFRNGATPEQIAQDYDSVSLADIYSTIAYYLPNQKEVEQYLKSREQQAHDGIRLHPNLYDQAGLRERLLARKGQRNVISFANPEPAATQTPRGH